MITKITSESCDVFYLRQYTVGGTPKVSHAGYLVHKGDYYSTVLGDETYESVLPAALIILTEMGFSGFKTERQAV